MVSNLKARLILGNGIPIRTKNKNKKQLIELQVKS